jgi:branched-chain amino acid transport system ATP-binding protein
MLDSEFMLEAKAIRSGYRGVTVIKGLHLSVGHEVFAILGANGAGKTTLLATLARLMPLMEGEIWFGGENISPDLGERRNQPAGTLSGGESRMVACARALMQDPKLLLLDEPTAGLSPLYVDNFFDRIREIHETRDVSIVLAEQNATKALEVADRVMVLSLGEGSEVMDARQVTTQTLKQGYQI